MNLKEFRDMVSKEFGSGMEHATPGNVRDFLDKMQFNVLSPEVKGRLVLEEYASSYEEVMKDFFAKVLEMPKDEAIIMLWLLAFDFAFSAIEIQPDERLKNLFKDFDE
jgi:hypothetical protein